MKNPRKITGRILAMILLVAFALTGSVIAAVAEPLPQMTAVELKTGDKGDEVAMTQNALIVWNPEALPLYGVDGFYGVETAAAISAFQTDNKLEATGICDTITWELLMKNAADAGVTVTAKRSPVKQNAAAKKKRPSSGSQSSGTAATPKATAAPAATPKATAAPAATPKATKQPAQPETTQPPAIDATKEPEATAMPKATATPKVAPTATPKVAPTATPKAAPTATPKCEHNWIENTTTHEVEEKGHYETMHHDAVTEKQRVLVQAGWTETWTVYGCPNCSEEYSNQSRLATHQSLTGHVGMNTRTASFVHDPLYQWQQVVVQEAYDEEVWVVDEPAHTEEIPNGTYTCSKCGATK